jgi:coatomer protein complex subunit gamma
VFKTSQEAVVLEAARGLLEIPRLKENLIVNSLETLKGLLTSNKKVVRFSALKTLDKAASKYHQVGMMDIFIDLEKIIDDNSNNASIKALALSIFLKISKSLSDSRLEKMFKTYAEQYTTFKEDFKKEIIQISRKICKDSIDNPNKMKLYFNFFANLLRLEASFHTKLEIVDSILWFVESFEQIKRNAILTLAEFIEDCQYDNLKTKILNVLGKEGPSIQGVSQIVRYIYNRIILENAVVRASAITALGEIAYKDKTLRNNILNLIKRSLTDIDNEVRERAYFYTKALIELDEKESKSVITTYLFTPKTYDLNLLKRILKERKEQLLQSPNISEELIKTMNDPNIISNLTKKLEVVEDKKKKAKTEKVTEDKSGDEYKKTSFSKTYGQPKIVTKLSVIFDNFSF